MLNRRNFLKTLPALGMGLLVPSRRPNAAAASPEMPIRPNSIGPVIPVEQRMQELATDDDGVLARERWADLLDDLDCVEIAMRYFGLTEFSRCVGDVNFWRSYCPFCGFNTLCTLEIGPESFRCDWCAAAGSTIELYARIEGLSDEDARCRLEVLLHDGTLVGRRPEYEHAWSLMGEAHQFYNQLLGESAEGAGVRSILTEQGISPSTIQQFMLGYAPAAPTDLLSRHLLEGGYDPECLQYVSLKAEHRSNAIVDRYAGGNLLIPIRDAFGHSWGFFQKALDGGKTNFDAGWIQSTVPVSERRRRRLIFPQPSWPQDFRLYENVLLAKTPWEVVALGEAGIENVAYILESTSVHDPIPRRTLLALANNIVCPIDGEGNGPTAAYDLINALGGDSVRLRVVSVPSKWSVIQLLTSGGAATVQEAMARAIPLHQWRG